MGRAVKGGVPPRARPSPQIRPTPKQAGPQAPEHHANDRSREHAESPGALYWPAPRRYHPQIKAQSRRPSECAALGKAEFGSVRGVGDLTEPVGQRVACAGRFLCHAVWSGGGCALVRHRGASMARPGRVGAAPRPAAKAERSLGEPRRQAQECGREPRRTTSTGFLHGVGRHAQSRDTGHRGSNVQQLAAERTGEGRPVRVTRCTKGTRAEHLVTAKGTCHVQSVLRCAGVVNAELRARGESGLRDRSRGSKSA